MSKVITFSRVFPAYHPKAGQPTFFVEKLWESIGLPTKDFAFNMPDAYQNFLRADSADVWAKHHIILAGNHWEVGDKFSPIVRSGKPYRSKQIIIAPDIEIKKVWKFEVRDGAYIYIDDKLVQSWNHDEIAKNDGLSEDDLKAWFNWPKPFTGQILCWNENINY